jgi:hypothetical protein
MIQCCVFPRSLPSQKHTKGKLCLRLLRPSLFSSMAIKNNLVLFTLHTKNLETIFQQRHSFLRSLRAKRKLGRTLHADPETNCHAAHILSPVSWAVQKIWKITNHVCAFGLCVRLIIYQKHKCIYHMCGLRTSPLS